MRKGKSAHLVSSQEIKTGISPIETDWNRALTRYSESRCDKVQILLQISGAHLDKPHAAFYPTNMTLRLSLNSDSCRGPELAANENGSQHALRLLPATPWLLLR